MIDRQNVTALLLAWNGGDAAALDDLIPLVTAELRKLAAHYLRGERPGHTLQPTALVNELYLRLIDRQQVSWRDRAHFFAFAAKSMRRILVDHARARDSEKRGGGARPLTLSRAEGIAGREEVDVIDLDRALSALGALDERQARLGELRFFGGLTLDETAAVLGVGTATVSRDWTTARAFLYRELSR
jgi:RNA polymerase sigma factor (TIGR02999 family)